MTKKNNVIQGMFGAADDEIPEHYKEIYKEVLDRSQELATYMGEQGYSLEQGYSVLLNTMAMVLKVMHSELREDTRDIAVQQISEVSCEILRSTVEDLIIPPDSETH